MNQEEIIRMAALKCARHIQEIVLDTINSVPASEIYWELNCFLGSF